MFYIYKKCKMFVKNVFININDVFEKCYTCIKKYS